MIRVLLVDDEPFIVQGLTELIDWKKEGFEIAGTAANGKEALEFLSVQEADLIISDIWMPLMTGLELLETVRKEKLSEAYFVLLSGYNDFAYAQQAIRNGCMDYFLKPVQRTELLAVIRKMAKYWEERRKEQSRNLLMEQSFLDRNLISILNGKFDRQDLAYVKKHMNLSGKMRYISLKVDETDLPRRDGEMEKRQLQKKLYQVCTDWLGQKYDRHCILNVFRYEKEYDIGFLYCSYMAEEQKCSDKEYLERFLMSICDQMKVPVRMLVGRETDCLEELTESYRNVVEMNIFKSFLPGGQIEFYEEKNNTDLVLLKPVLDALVQAVEQKQRAEIDKNLKIFYENANCCGMNLEWMNLNVNYLLYQLFHLATELDDHVDQKEILEYIRNKAFGYDIMHGNIGYMKEFLYEYTEYLSQLRKNISHGILSDIELEVRDHYMENLTLKELGEKYFINSAYLGQLFRKKYGKTFKEYLNEYRIEQAADLLLRTDKKVYEIAQEVGYRDLDYFINRFIAVKGCTPTRFRKL